ncbi:hypothetical protein ASE04_27330 [Rhizobium sp. Root708]|uniref:hypothetical protein n=1 Tax=Rhizobium sp. Root708 TaxID=1736592 RepID=UPI0006FAF67D|nr:hypothetical protein [Rhizobium sp. Root708]KRB59109.1 hypothetical protein ASE04_27330 [Rhizobium sp. Root708]
MYRFEVARWALDHGFTRLTSYALGTEYEGLSVRMLIGMRYLTTSLVHETSEDTLAHIPHSEIFCDKNGMIHGAGLNSEFIDRMIRGQPAPQWWPAAHLKAVESELSRPQVIDAVRQSYGARPG